MIRQNEFIIIEDQIMGKSQSDNNRVNFADVLSAAGEQQAKHQDIIIVGDVIA